MSMPPYVNGGWPELPPVPPPIEDLPPNATPLQVMRALGSTLLMFGQLWPRTVQALEYLRAGLMRVESAQKHPELPPMRAQLASTNDLAKAVGLDVAQAFERDQRNPSTPPPTGTTVASMVEERVQIELLRIKASNLQKEKDDREALEREKRASRRKIGVAAIVSGLAIIAALVEHFAR